VIIIIIIIQYVNFSIQWHKHRICSADAELRRAGSWVGWKVPKSSTKGLYTSKYVMSIRQLEPKWFVYSRNMTLKIFLWTWIESLNPRLNLWILDYSHDYSLNSHNYSLDSHDYSLDSHDYSLDIHDYIVLIIMTIVLIVMTIVFIVMNI
jgi:hypothetical protein